eukprot:COSAG02_NODE_807_length_16930_cov_21.113719_10_plen_231_part_00
MTGHSTSAFTHIPVHRLPLVPRGANGVHWQLARGGKLSALEYSSRVQRADPVQSSWSWQKIMPRHGPMEDSLIGVSHPPSPEHDVQSQGAIHLEGTGLDPQLQGHVAHDQEYDENHGREDGVELLRDATMQLRDAERMYEPDGLDWIIDHQYAECISIVLMISQPVIVVGMLYAFGSAFGDLYSSGCTGVADESRCTFGPGFVPDFGFGPHASMMTNHRSCLFARSLFSA